MLLGAIFTPDTDPHHNEMCDMLFEPFTIHPAKLLAKPYAGRTTTDPQATVYAGCSALSASMVVSAVAAGGRSICSLTLIVKYSEQRRGSPDKDAVRPHPTLSVYMDALLTTFSYSALLTWDYGHIEQFMYRLTSRLYSRRPHDQSPTPPNHHRTTLLESSLSKSI